MLSRAEMWVRIEHVLRGALIVVLAVMLWRSVQQQSEAAGRNLDARGVDAGMLAEWSSLASAPTTVQLQLDSVPSPIDRAWLGALAAAGTRIEWNGQLPALMLHAQPIASPLGGTKVLVASPRESSVLLSDDVGTIDTLRSNSGAQAISLEGVVGQISARVKGATAATVRRDSVLLRRILVIGSAAWETKFVAAALEEEGWKVDALIAVAPDARITQGSAAAIDTSRYSAVVALDATVAPHANRIEDFVRRGGGLVIAPPAASLDAMAAIRAGAAGRMLAGRATPAAGSMSRATLAVKPILSLRSDAVPLETRDGTATVVARRAGAGRVVQIGYEDTWRWRMGGADEALRDYRNWWTELVSSVAYAPRLPTAAAHSRVDESPVAGLVAAIGPNVSSEARTRMPGQSTDWRLPLFLLLALVLVAEVASRRLRAAP